MEEKKQSSKLQQVRYRKLALNGGNTIMTYNNAGRVQPKGVLIEFPMIDNNDNGIIPIPDVKIYEEEIYRKNNYRAVKALMKVYEEDRRKNSFDCMNMLGLDIKKINYVPPQRNGQSLSKIDKVKIKSRNISPSLYRTKESARSQLRNTTEASDTESRLLPKDQQSGLIKLEAAQSAFFNKVKNKDPSCSPSPKRARTKKKYLYEQLAGRQQILRDQVNHVYERRIKSYTELLWKLQYSHNIYINLDLKNEEIGHRGRKYKAYVGSGNNSAMIKGLLKRRFWWTFSDDKSECCFIWTQIKIKAIFEKQKNSLPGRPKYKTIQQFEQLCKKTSPVRRSQSIGCKKTSTYFTEIYNNKVLNENDEEEYKKYLNKYERQKERLYQYRYQHCGKHLQLSLSENSLVHNHLQNNFYLGNKKALFYSLKQYYDLCGKNVFDYIPVTFHIKKGFKDIQYKRFVAYYNKRKSLMKKEEKEEQQGYSVKRKTRNIWIVKPGENTNQGRGITVIDEIYELNMIMKKNHQVKPTSPNKASKKKIPQNLGEERDPQEEDDPDYKRTFIVQMYLDRPFLYQGRKFDIRHYVLLTNIYGIMRAYWYTDGYIRTSSYEFNIDNFEPQIHLTNDSIQKKYLDYGKYQSHNKISYEDFQRYLDSAHGGKKYNFKKTVLRKMKQMSVDAVKSVYTKISPKNQQHNFEILGLDFMIDRHFRPWLIEINTNPCLDCSCPLLDRIVPYMVEQSLKMTLDVVYPPPTHYPNTCKHYAPLINLEAFKYQLIFDSQVDGDQLRAMYKKGNPNLRVDEIGDISDDEQFKDEGKQIKLDDYT